MSRNPGLAKEFPLDLRMDMTENRHMNGIFEMLMLLCFGAAWPFSIYKSWTSKATGGKSAVFLIIVFMGYLAGITNKLLNGTDYVLTFYIINAVLVFVDILLFFRNRFNESRLADSLSGGTPMDNQMKKHHF